LNADVDRVDRSTQRWGRVAHHLHHQPHRVTVEPSGDHHSIWRHDGRGAGHGSNARVEVSRVVGQGFTEGAGRHGLGPAQGGVSPARNRDTARGRPWLPATPLLCPQRDERPSEGKPFASDVGRTKVHPRGEQRHRHHDQYKSSTRHRRDRRYRPALKFPAAAARTQSRPRPSPGRLPFTDRRKGRPPRWRGAMPGSDSLKGSLRGGGWRGSPRCPGGRGRR
jgi:hypothetical protein